MMNPGTVTLLQRILDKENHAITIHLSTEFSPTQIDQRRLAQLRRKSWKLDQPEKSGNALDKFYGKQGDRNKK
ncbi:hypothetical protein Y032_0386g435 [Ancylostoma ceylanicum]|nr:hypothetical protein Y032_0386g435 [Ancylostoma ceylanicum]